MDDSRDANYKEEVQENVEVTRKLSISVPLVSNKGTYQWMV